MLLAITTRYTPATDLGYLLHKSPGRVHTFELPFGFARVFYSEATAAVATAVLMVDVDPIGLVRRPKGGSDPGLIRQYVNDRPYATSSLMSSAISKTFGSAMNGRSDSRRELAETAIPLEAHLPVVSCPGGEGWLRELFEPLGYTVEVKTIPLDPASPSWGDSRYLDVRLSATVRLADLLKHLYVLLPVLDGDKHYWIGADEVDKLLAKGTGWLESHPRRDAIVQRYLRRKQRFVREALARLVEADGGAEAETADTVAAGEGEEALERTLSLNEQRLGSVMAVLKAANARRVLDLGCGEGRFTLMLARDPEFDQIFAMDVMFRSMEATRAAVDRLAPRVAARVETVQGSLLYADDRMTGWDAAVLIEVIEHIEPHRLTTVERNIFGHARPHVVVVTTPNSEYNVRFEGLGNGGMRHGDHRFEWTRAEFGGWADRVADQYGYRVRMLPIGPIDPEVGSPTQMAVFER